MKKPIFFLISLFITIPCLAQAQKAGINPAYPAPASNAPEDDCFPQTHPDYQEWINVGRPACWCYSRQCRGDINGIMHGPFWVQVFDLDLFKAAFNKTDAQLPPDGVCADLDHVKYGPFRVQVFDLDIFLNYFNKLESQVPDCFEPCWIDPWCG